MAQSQYAARDQILTIYRADLQQISHWCLQPKNVFFSDVVPSAPAQDLAHRLQNMLILRSCINPKWVAGLQSDEKKNIPGYTHAFFMEQEANHLPCSGIGINLMEVKHSFTNGFNGVPLLMSLSKAHAKTNFCKFCKAWASEQVSVSDLKIVWRALTQVHNVQCRKFSTNHPQSAYLFDVSSITEGYEVQSHQAALGSILNSKIWNDQKDTHKLVSIG